MDRLDELKSRFGQEPLGQLLGARLETLEDGRAVVSATARTELTIVGGLVQGGVTAAVADYAGVYAAMTRIPAGHTPAAHISIDFLRPVRDGETMRAEAAVINESRGSIHVSVAVFGAGGKLKAQSLMSFAKPNR